MAEAVQVKPSKPTLTVEQFATFFTDYTTGSDNNRKFSKAEHLVTTNLRDFMGQTFDAKPPINFTDMDFSSYGTIIKEHPEFIAIKRGPFLYTVFTDRAIFIENPTAERLDEIRGIATADPYRRAPVNRAISWCDTFVVTTHGDVWFREPAKEFYDLVKAGEVERALTFAISVIDRALGR
ncbi:MAG: hypothetical protein PHT13_00955 [Methanosarcina sp.]|nr:hypothetical protein [Methanosarcina sp.]